MACGCPFCANSGHKEQARSFGWVHSSAAHQPVSTARAAHSLHLLRCAVCLFKTRTQRKTASRRSFRNPIIVLIRSRGPSTSFSTRAGPTRRGRWRRAEERLGAGQSAVAKLDFHFLAKSEKLYPPQRVERDFPSSHAILRSNLRTFNHRFQYTFMGLDMGKLKEVACGK
jgi:hypothetical protein